MVVVEQKTWRFGVGKEVYKGHVAYELRRLKKMYDLGVLMMQSNLPGLNPRWPENAVPTWTFASRLQISFVRYIIWLEGNQSIRSGLPFRA
jgi:hypothetical protein